MQFDSYEGYIDNKQFEEISEEHYISYKNQSDTVLSSELIDFITEIQTAIYTIPFV